MHAAAAAAVSTTIAPAFRADSVISNAERVCKTTPVACAHACPQEATVLREIS